MSDLLLIKNNESLKLVDGSISSKWVSTNGKTFGWL